MLHGGISAASHEEHCYIIVAQILVTIIEAPEDQGSADAYHKQKLLFKNATSCAKLFPEYPQGNICNGLTKPHGG